MAECFFLMSMVTESAQHTPTLKLFIVMKARKPLQLGSERRPHNE